MDEKKAWIQTLIFTLGAVAILVLSTLTSRQQIGLQFFGIAFAALCLLPASIYFQKAHFLRTQRVISARADALESSATK